MEAAAARPPAATEAPVAVQKKRKQRSKRHTPSERGTALVHSAADIAAIVSGVPPGEYAPIPTLKESDSVYLYTEERAADDDIIKTLQAIRNPTKTPTAPAKKRRKNPKKAAPVVREPPPPREEVPPTVREDDVWYREQDIFHDFVPQSVEAQIMAAQAKTRELARHIASYADATINQLREFGAAVGRTIDENDEASLERLEAFDVINKNLRKNLKTISTGLENCASALYSLNTTSKGLNSKHRALFRNIRSHLYNSYIFDANTPGSSLLLDPSVPQ